MRGESFRSLLRFPSCRRVGLAARKGIPPPGAVSVRAQKRINLLDPIHAGPLGLDQHDGSHMYTVYDCAARCQSAIPGPRGSPASRDPFPGDPGIRGPLHPRRLRCPPSPYRGGYASAGRLAERGAATLSVHGLFRNGPLDAGGAPLSNAHDLRPLAAVPLDVISASLHRPLRGTPRIALGPRTKFRGDNLTGDTSLPPHGDESGDVTGERPRAGVTGRRNVSDHRPERKP